MKSLLIYLVSALLTGTIYSLQTWTSGPNFDMTKENGKLKIEAFIPKNNYLAIAFGEGMENTDMVFFDTEN